jgi:hypothetical protein
MQAPSGPMTAPALPGLLLAPPHSHPEPASRTLPMDRPRERNPAASRYESAPGRSHLVVDPVATSGCGWYTAASRSILVKTDQSV